MTPSLDSKDINSLYPFIPVTIMCKQDLVYRGQSAPTPEQTTRRKHGVRRVRRRSVSVMNECGSRGQRPVLFYIFVAMAALASLSCFTTFYAFSIVTSDETRFVGVFAPDHFLLQALLADVGITQRQPSALHRPSQHQPTPGNRSIVLIHVGKTGGLTIRQNLAHSCSLVDLPTTAKKQDRIRQKCRERMNANNTGLSLQTHAVFHNKDYNSTAVKEATTFVITLRNPIDRIHSVYRYSHPQVMHDLRSPLPISDHVKVLNSCRYLCRTAT